MPTVFRGSQCRLPIVMAESFGPVHAVAKALDDERRANARADMAALYERYSDGLGPSVPFTYLVCIGVRR